VLARILLALRQNFDRRPAVQKGCVFGNGGLPSSFLSSEAVSEQSLERFER